MRSLNIINSSVDTSAKKEIRDRIHQLNSTGPSMDKILKEMNGGNMDLIDDLLISAEELILKVMLHMPDSRFSIDERVSHAKDSLKRLALLNSNLQSRRIFERFCAFHVRQYLIALEDSKMGH